MKHLNTLILSFLLSLSLMIWGSLPCFSVQETLAYLLHPPGAKATSMGYAYTAVSDSNAALYTNPAGLTQLKNKQWRVTQFQSLEANFIATDYTIPFDGFTLSFGYFGARLGGIEETILASNTLVRTGDTFEYQGNSLRFALALPVWESYFKKHLPESQLSLGVTFSLLHEKIHSLYAIGSGMNGGFLWQSKFNNTPYRAGLYFKHIVPPTLQWDNTKTVRETMPMDISFGLSSYFFEENALLWSISLHQFQKKNPSISLGTEFSLTDMICLRAGLFNKDISAGLGFKLQKFTLDFSYTLSDPRFKDSLDPMTKFSFTMDIDKVFIPKPPPIPAFKIEYEDNENLVGLYRSNIGIYKSTANAISAAKLLKKHKIKFKIIRVMRNRTEPGYKVVTKAFKSPEEAEAHLDKLHKIGFKKFLRRIKDETKPTIQESLSSASSTDSGPPLPPKYEVNIGIFLTQKQALQKILSLQENGITPRIKAVIKADKVTGYRVITGYFNTKDDLDIHTQQLKILGYKQFVKTRQ